MIIEHYISQLLYRYQCVTVPGFGAFLTETQSAQLHEATHSFYPPKKMLSFNAYLKNNDGLLANHIAQSEKMTYEVAVSAIENQVATWKQSLLDSKKMEFKNIGVFTLNSENNLVFVPADQVNYLTSSFGLTSFLSPSVKRELYKQEVEALEEKAPIVFTPEKRASNHLMKYAAIFVFGAGLLGAGYFTNTYYQNKAQEETLAVQSKVQKRVNQKIQQATFFIDAPISPVTLTVANVENKEVKETKTATPYHIIAGAFSSKENADKLYKTLIQQGFKAQKLEVNKHGLYPVVYGSYSNSVEAQKALSEIKKTNNPDAWLLVEEL